MREMDVVGILAESQSVESTTEGRVESVLW